MGFSPCFIVKSLKQIQSFMVKSSFFTIFHPFFDGKLPPGPPPLQQFPPFRWSLRNSSVASSKRVPIRSASAPKMGRFVSSMGTWNALGKSLTFLGGFHQQQVGIDRYIYGSVSKPCTPVVHIKIAGKWMLIPLKMVLIGIDPYPYIYIYIYTHCYILIRSYTNASVYIM